MRRPGRKGRIQAGVLRVRYLAALGLVVVVPLAAGCGSGASQEELDSLETRVAALEKTVAELESETEAVRALSERLDGFMEEAEDKLSQLDEIRSLLESLGDLIP